MIRIEHLDVNIKGYSIPLFYADATTPTYSVRSDVGGSGWTGSNGQNTTGTMPIPGNAVPDPDSDHHLLVIDKQQMKARWTPTNSSTRSTWPISG